MAETLKDMLAQSYQITATQTVKTTDDRGGPTNRTLAAGWYRTRLAAAAGVGTEADPTELCAALTTALGASKWRVALVSTGYVEITYLGTGTGSIDLSTSLPVRALLGFTGNVGPLATNTAQAGAHLPTHCVLSTHATDDSGWIDTARRFAGAALPDGTVYGWDDGRMAYRRTVTLSMLPRDTAARTALGASGTPCYATTGARLLSPSTSEPAQAPPWTVTDTLGTIAGRSCGLALGTLQQIIAGTVTEYVTCYTTPEMHGAGSRIVLPIAGYDGRRGLVLELSLTGVGAL